MKFEVAFGMAERLGAPSMLSTLGLQCRYDIYGSRYGLHPPINHRLGYSDCVIVYPLHDRWSSGLQELPARRV
jgi:hypothetical protein